MPALTRNQTRTFFTVTIGVADDSVIAALNREGIEELEDLVDFDDETIKMVAENMRKPVGDMQDPNNANARINVPAKHLGAKSVLRLQYAAKLFQFYEDVGRALTTANTTWEVIKAFKVECDALEKRGKDEDEPEVPKISKSLPVLKWTVAFQDFSFRALGVRNIPLAYVIREDDVPQPINSQATGKPFSEEHGSVEAELIARASHNHALFRDDNAKLYHHIEEATRGTVYAASIQPFQKTKAGKEAWEAITSQFAGDDKWDKLLKDQEEIIHKRKWQGNGSFRLENFVAQHRNAFVLLTQCSQRVDYQLPNDMTRVKYLLDAIETTDSQLQANIALVRADKGVNGKMRSFEKAAAFIVPACPVARRKTITKKQRADISEVDTNTEKEANVDSVDKTKPKPKPCKGKTGVELRFYARKAYNALTQEQKDELAEWRAKRDAGKRKSPDNSGSAKKKVKIASSETTATSEGDKEPAEASSATKSPSKLRGILRKAKS